MGASTTIIKDPYFTFDSVDYSAQVKEIQLNFSLDEIEATASGDTAHVFVPGLEKYQIQVKALRNTALDAALWAAKGLLKACAFRRSTGAKAAGNPEYSLTSAFVSNYPVLGGPVGAADEITITLVANSAMARATA